MINFKSIIALMMLVFSLTQCNSQTKTTTTMETTNTTQTATKEIIVDVRSIEEWNEDGHADCSVNYPLDQFASKIEELKKYDKVILVCRSGNRAGIAKGQLQSAGYTKEIENLGPWQNVTCKTK
jgi:rhodanese-related sulfurtransferase